MAGVQRQRTQLSLSNPGVSEIRVGTSGGGSFAQGLLDAATAATTIGSDYIGQKVEADKVLQANRALKGLMPTEDATAGGARANMMVGAQNGINEMSARLKEDAASWQGTDAEWDQHVVQQRIDFENGIHQKYPELVNDRTTSKMVTNMFMEQQPTIQASKIAADLQREHIDRANTFQTRMTQTTAGLDGVALTRSLEDLRPVAKALKLSDTEFEQAIAGEAKARAATGDVSFLMATKGIKNSDGVSLYDRDASIRSAVIQGQRMELSLNQAELSDQKYGLEQSFLSGDMSVPDLISAASSMNAKYGGAAYSAAEINSLRDQKSRADAKQGKKVDFVGKIDNGQLVALEDYTEKEINEGSAAFHDQGDAMVDALASQKGYTEEQKEGLRAKVQSEITVKLARAGIKDQQLVRQINSFQNIGPDHLKAMTQEPAEMQELLNRWNTLPDYMRNQIVGDKPAAFISNYQLGLSNNMNPGQALDFAQKAGRDITFSGKDNKAIYEAGDSVAGDLISNSGWNPFDNYPDFIRQQLKDFATDDVRRFRKAGYDEDAAKEQASLNLANNYTYIGGTVVRGDRKMLAQRLKLNEEDLGTQFQSYLQANKQKFEDDAGGPGINEMYFDIDQQRGLFTVRAGSSGIPVQGARPLSELGDYKWIDQMQKANGTSKAEMRDRVMQAEGYAFGRPVGDSAASVGKSVMDALFPPAGAAQVSPELQHGEIQKNETFSTYLATAENQTKAGFDPRAGVFIPYDSDIGTSGVDTIGYGHKLTKEERENGFITIDNNPVPYREGESQLTEGQAQRLLQQDIKAHIPATKGWDKNFDELPGDIRRALIDTSFNMGKGFLNNNPTANAWFKQGDYQSGFIQLLTASNENGKRSKGVLVRRASAYNLAGANAGWPKISKVDVGKDGSMRVKFSGSLESVNPAMKSIIDPGGWLLVKRGKAGSLHSQSTPGSVDL